MPAIPITGILFASSWQLIRLGYADSLSREESVAQRRRAAQMFPGDVDFINRLAAVRERNGQSIHAELKRAVQTSPEDGPLWLNLGVDSERRGDHAEAEKQFLEAARLSTQYAPRWELARYYYRQGQRTNCAHWLREALKTVTDDPSLPFLMALRLHWTSSEVMSLLPRNDTTLILYLNWLTAQRELAQGEPVARELAHQYPKSGRDALLSYCDRLLLDGPDGAERAAAVWNELASAGVIGNDERIFPAQAPKVVNGAFVHPPMQAAFDWIVLPVQGVTNAYQRPGLRFTLSGDEPEDCRLLRQLLSVKPGGKYVIRYSHQSSGITTGSGLAWHVLDARTHAELTDSTVYLDDTTDHPSVTFRAPADCRFVELILAYRRQPGTVRVEGELNLQRVELAQG